MLTSTLALQRVEFKPAVTRIERLVPDDAPLRPLVPEADEREHFAVWCAAMVREYRRRCEDAAAAFEKTLRAEVLQ